jgi:hypothetical protein
MKSRDQVLHFRRRPLDPLEEDAAAENQHPGYASVGIAALRELDKAIDLFVTDAFGGTAAVHESFKRNCRVFQVSFGWKAGFVEHE